MSPIRTMSLAISLACLALCGGCGDDDPAGPGNDDPTYSWQEVDLGTLADGISLRAVSFGGGEGEGAGPAAG